MKVKSIFFALFLMLPSYIFAQITDNFSDGDFTNNPTWTGSSSKFIVNTNQQLQLKGIAANDTAYLSTANTLINNTEWKIWMRSAFKGSTSNYTKIYLVANKQDLKSTMLNGYYLRIGKTGNLDGVDLYRQTGKTSTLIIPGIAGRAAKSNNIINIKVQRDNIGTWTLFSDTTGGSNYTQEGRVLDNTYNTTNYFGVSCRYSSANKTKFYFDDISISQFITDTIPPKLDSVKVIDQTHVNLYFSEPIEPLSAENTDNYAVNNSLGKPINALRDAIRLNIIHLEFGTAFTDNVLYTLTATSILDNASNQITTNNKAQFTYHAPVVAILHDVLINEIFADPTPRIGLPEKEFIELYNRSAKTLNIVGWKFTDGSKTAIFGTKNILPNSYLILCSNSDTSDFKPYGKVLGLSNFPSLNNSGDNLKLTNKTGNIIDQVNYSDEWYRDKTKKEGGYSLERIDPEFLCSDLGGQNWLASKSDTGGTPGKINSVNGHYVDSTAPKILNAFAINDTTISIVLSEPIDPYILQNPYLYSISGFIFNPKPIYINGDTIVLKLYAKLTFNTIYTLTINDTLADCSGNKIGNNNTVKFALSQDAQPYDIIVNEILFNPKTGGVDFVEIYNRSKKAINLKSILLANNDTQYPISSDNKLLFPNEYKALSTNPQIVKNHHPNTIIENCIAMKHLPSFNNDKGTVIIKNANGVIDHFNYTEKMHFSLINNNEGVSLERISTSNLDRTAANWHSAAETAGFATPGFRNSQAVDENDLSNKKIVIDPEIFSPDNDGYNDVLSIHYNVKNVGLLGSITLFDSHGNTIRHLVKNELLGINGTYTWDGINDTGDKARVGIYIIYFETTDTKDGAIDAEKLTCVLGAKL
jgi:hypothetical protein